MNAAFVCAQKWELLRDRMRRLGIREDDICEKFILSGGPGGQKVNKTSSCVQLTHAPSGLRVKCRDSRHREINRYRARARLCDLLEEKLLGEASRIRQEFEKIRRRKRRRSRRQNEKRLAEKRLRAELKRARAQPAAEE